ncbi:MAG: DUF2784 domain-containing protein [Planctomycetaceae bacterium]|nr:DUF2784 domain-containing protein [Planctomycetaceae bacterium]
MTLLYRILADFVVVVHFAYVSFVLFGLIAILLGGICGWNWVRNRAFRVLHLVMIVVVVLESWAGIVCPLTTWENQLRRLAGDATHRGAFIADLLHDLMFFEAEPWVFTVCYSLFGAAVIGTLFLVPPRWRTPNRKTAAIVSSDVPSTAGLDTEQ